MKLLILGKVEQQTLREMGVIHRHPHVQIQVQSDSGVEPEIDAAEDGRRIPCAFEQHRAMATALEQAGVGRNV